MFALGLLAFCQMTFLPGALLLRILKFRGGFIQSLLYAFGASLTLNCAAVTLLTLLGLYRRGVVLALLVLELLALAWLYRDVWRTAWGEGLTAAWNRLALTVGRLFPLAIRQDADENVLEVLRAALRLIAALLAVSGLLWMVRVFQLNLGTVFNSWDAVVSWNSWALGWAAGHFPDNTGYYPQLLPTNWSLTYLLAGSMQVQFFAKALMPLFLLLTFAALFEMGLSSGEMGFFLAVPLTQLVTKKFAGEFIAEGYADVPVALMGFLAVFALLKAGSVKDVRQKRLELLLAGLFAAGAALTKQAGVFILLLFPLLAYLLVVSTAADRRAWMRRVWGVFGLALLLTLPWYLARFILIAQGAQRSNVAWVTSGIYGGLSVAGRMVAAFGSLGKYAGLVLFILLALPFLKRPYRWLVILVALPYTLIWMAFFSYETRNLALAFPFIGLGAGLGLGALVEGGLRLLARLRPARLKPAALLVLLLAAALAAGVWFPAARLEASQETQQKQIFNPDLNAKLYQFAQTAEPGFKILSLYPLRFLPGLEDHQVEYWFTDLDSFRQALRSAEVGTILLPNNANAAVLDYVEQKLAAKEYQLLFSDDHYIPSRLIRVRQKAGK